MWPLDENLHMLVWPLNEINYANVANIWKFQYVHNHYSTLLQYKYMNITIPYVKNIFNVNLYRTHFCIIYFYSKKRTYLCNFKFYTKKTYLVAYIKSLQCNSFKILPLNRFYVMCCKLYKRQFQICEYSFHVSIVLMKMYSLHPALENSLSSTLFIFKSFYSYYKLHNIFLMYNFSNR